MPDPITPDTVRALLDDPKLPPGPWEWSIWAGRHPARLCTEAQFFSGEGWFIQLDKDRVNAATAALIAAAPRIAADYLAVSAERDAARAEADALRAEGERLRASRARWTVAAGIASDTFCPQCGLGVRVDEDGCCRTCGNGAMGAAVDSRRASIEEAEAADVAAGVDHG